MEIKEIKKFKEGLLNLRLRDLRNKEFTGNLQEVRLVLTDIFTMFKSKGKPVVINTSQSDENKSKAKTNSREEWEKKF